MVQVSRRRFLASSTAAAFLSTTAGNVRAEPRAPDTAGVSDLTTCSATELADLICQRRVSSQAVIEAYIGRIMKVNRAINAVVDMVFDKARHAAQAADEAIHQGSIDWKRQPLLGVPVTIKDAFDVTGMATTCGVPRLKDKLAEVDATAVRKLKEAGAIILGKTNVPALCMHFETDNSVYRQTKNPYDLARTPGGSSGGEAAIVASGGSPLGLGTDGGGSIRTPAHFCGIAGIRPGWGRVSLAGSFPPAPHSYGNYYTAGPMARYVEDLAFALRVLSGPDPRDPFTFPVPLLDYKEVELEDLRVAFWTKYEPAETTKETRETIEKAAAHMQKIGARVEEKCPPHWDKVYAILQAVYDQEIATFETLLKEFGVDAPTLVDRAAIAYGKEHSGKLPADQIKTAIDDWLPMFQIAMLQFFEEYDALLLPVSAGPAVPHGESWNRVDDFGFTLGTSLVPKIPAGSVRCGWSPEKLPIGVQIVTKPYREDIALAIMRQLESQFGGWNAPPEDIFESP